MGELDKEGCIKTTIEWYNKENCPENDRPILAYTANKKIMTIKNVRDDWKWYADKYAIDWWAYQDKINIE